MKQLDGSVATLAGGLTVIETPALVWTIVTAVIAASVGIFLMFRLTKLIAAAAVSTKQNSTVSLKTLRLKEVRVVTCQATTLVVAVILLSLITSRWSPALIFTMGIVMGVTHLMYRKRISAAEGKGDGDC